MLSILLKTTEYCGDHSRDVAIAQEPRPGETVEDLAARLLSGSTGSFMDTIEIRLAKPSAQAALRAADGEATPQPSCHACPDGPPADDGTHCHGCKTLRAADGEGQTT